MGGTEDAQDLDFFRQYSLPLIKMALLEFLQLDTVEIPTSNPLTGAAGGTWDSHHKVSTDNFVPIPVGCVAKTTV